MLSVVRVMQREIKTEQHKATTLFTLIEKSLISSRGSGRAWRDQEEYGQINVQRDLQHVNQPAVQAFSSGAQMFLLAKAPCGNFPKRGGNGASQRERESKMAATTIPTRTRFLPPKIRLHCRLHVNFNCKPGGSNPYDQVTVIT